MPNLAKGLSQPLTQVLSRGLDDTGEETAVATGEALTAGAEPLTAGAEPLTAGASE